MIDWRDLVRGHARQTGAPDLPAHALDELAAHLEDIYAAARAAGLDDRTARERAIAALSASRLSELKGSARRLREPAAPPGMGVLHRTSPFRSLSMLQAIRFAFRQFLRHPAFAGLTVLVLGLSIGAGVAVYTVVDAVLLKPLPYREPARLAMLWDVNNEKGLRHEPLSPVNFMDYHDTGVFEGAAAWWRPDVNLADPGSDPVRVKTIETGANLFDVLGVQPQVGPGFPANGPMFSTEQIAVISDRLWRTRYSADPKIIGRLLQLNGAAYAVVGVMPARFDFPGDIDVWQRSRWDFHNHSRAAHFMEAVVRTKPNSDLSVADAAATGLAQRLEKDFARTNRGWSVRLIPLVEDQLGYYRAALFVLFGAVGLLMTIGCLNVASLLLTRALSREREVAVRTALGASRRHLIVQLLAEAGILSAAGSVVGVIAAVVALPLIIAFTPVPIPRLAEAALNWRVLLFALAAGTVMTMVFGLVPGLALVRRNVTVDLKSGERGSSRTSRVLHRALVAVEVAFACALLIASGLLIRTVSRMTDVPTGVTRGTTMTASVQLSASGAASQAPSAALYESWQRVSATYQTLLDRVRAQPGVKSAGAANFLPLDPGWRVGMAIEGQPPIPAQDLPQTQMHSVTDGFFEALGAQLAAGRWLTANDRAGTAGVLVVNEAFGRKFLPGENPLGKIVLNTAQRIGPLGFNLMTPAPPPVPPATPVPAAPMRFEIVGIVHDVRDVALGQPIEPAVYFSENQFPFRAMFLAVDATDGPTAVRAMQSALHDVDPSVPLADVKTWADRMGARTGEARLLMTVLVFFGVLAAGLAVLGIYGLFSWMVTLRRRELAIRLTLGAKPAGIGWLVVRQAGVLVVIGLAAGWALVRVADASLSRVLFDTKPGDVSTTAAAILILFVASIVACMPPMWRAMRVDPVEGLRLD